MENTQTPVPENKLTAKALFNRDDVKAKFQEMLGKRSTSFITSVLQIVASNELLAKAEPTSIYQSAAVAATLELPLNNSLGFAYIVPYNESYKDDFGNWQKKTVAQFQIGYKGFKQLALRSGQFLTIHATDVREGEIKKRDRLTGRMEFDWVENEDERNKLKIVGYVSHFVLLNGFSQTFYMTVEKLREHAKKYSQTFQRDKGRWKDDFDGMCLKTVTKLNLSKNAPLSVEMQKAVIADQAVINDADTLDVTYADNDSPASEKITWEELNTLVEERIDSISPEDFEDAKRILAKREENSYRKIYDKLNANAAANGNE
jgi:recombination protein RecT